MISYLKGVFSGKTEDAVIIDIGGIGFSVCVSAGTAQEMPPAGSEVKLYTYLYVKEDILALYGFLRKEELELFQMLLKVSGIGPKGAVSILSGMSVNDLRYAIFSQDAKTIAKKSAGIGLKTAQKLILELKDKVHAEDMLPDLSGAAADVPAPAGSAKSEAVLALSALGYPNAQAVRAVQSVEGADAMTVEEILKAALRFM